MKTILSILVLLGGLALIGYYLNDKGIVDLAELKEKYLPGGVGQAEAEAGGGDMKPPEPIADVPSRTDSGSSSFTDGLPSPEGTPKVMRDESPVVDSRVERYVPTPDPDPVPDSPLLAPDGVYYLVKRYSVTTSSGIVGFDPGTQVRMVSEDGERSLIAVSGHEIEVLTEDLTNDLRRLRSIMNSQHIRKVTAGSP